MVVKRPQGMEAQVAVPEVQLIDEVVRRSLEVNPQLRQGMSTHQFLSKLRDQIVAESKKQSAAAAPSRPEPPRQRASAGDLASQTLALFMEKIGNDFEQQSAELVAQIEALKKKHDELRRRFADQVLDFLQLLWADAKTPPSVEAIKPYRAQLAQLGLTDNEVMRQVLRGRR